MSLTDVDKTRGHDGAPTSLGLALWRAAGLGERMASAELLGGAPVVYTGRALCAMYGLPYTSARGRALLAAVEAGKREESAAALGG